MLLGQCAPARFRLAGQQAFFVAMTKHVFDDRLHVLDLRTAFDVIVAAHRVRMNDLKVEGGTALLTLATARSAADLRQRTADIPGVKLVNQAEAVAFMRAKRQ